MLLSSIGLSQDNLGIGTQNPDPSAIVDIVSNDKGLLIPRLTTTQKNSITGLGEGLLVYEIDESALTYHDGSRWITFARFPVGAILPFHGSVIPEGWRLCDGTGGTPDLSGKFVVGYGSGADYDVIGESHGETAVSLSNSEMPAHNHSVTDSHSHSGTTSQSHSHTYSYTYKQLTPGGSSALPPGTMNVVDFNESFPLRTTGVVNNSASSNTNTTGASINNTGSGQAHENRPTFYVIAFIIRTE